MNLPTPHLGDFAPPEVSTPLSEEHQKMLFEESAIQPEVAAVRGYWTATRRTDVPEVFPEWQRKRGLVIPIYSPDGETTSYQLKPYKPTIRKGKTRKYEQPHKAECILDLHPFMRHAIQDPSIPLWWTEGIKKGDSLTSRGCCTISVVGVWNWQREGELLPCWEHIALKGRAVYVVYDSDVMVKPEVQMALERLVAALEERGARANVIYLPEVAHG